MSACFRAVLIALLLLTSQGLAAARGQAHIAGELILCAGGEVVTLTVDQNGRPVERVTICPDMALNLMSAVAVATPVAPVRDKLHQLPKPIAALHGTGCDAPTAQARDPPTVWFS
ncbi:hypothetical protein [Paracoccus albus]|uniref:hypothetical protein n=1 Tax=Paracoccus albus TaxID=3017784 RepID=UPI0022F0B5E4|nr:hypothetical protein [Paracoccus albus]WBU59764.1 hypothetical protein PAF20_13540 [Paracoccus albus]